MFRSIQIIIVTRVEFNFVKMFVRNLEGHGADDGGSGVVGNSLHGWMYLIFLFLLQFCVRDVRFRVFERISIYL